MKRMIVVGLCLALAAAAAGCSTSDSSSQGVPGTVASGEQNSGQTGETAYGKGETAEIEGVKVTLLDVTENTGSEYLKPKEGNVFLLCEFEIDNQSSDEVAVSTALSFECYVDDVKTTLSISALSSKEDKEQLDGTVAAGKKMVGVVGYEVSEDWKDLSLSFKPDVLSTDKLIFETSKE